MADSDVSEWTLDGVLDEISGIHSVMKDRQFAFILGAGASFTSGIPTGQNLAQKWLKDLHLRECADGRSIDEWINECGVGDGGLTWQTAAEHYPQIFERRFDGDREAGYAELEAAMEGKLPSLGYSLLAEIIQHTRHKVVVTTNFDNLVADALAMHAHQSPLIVAHESLAGFVRPQLRRPLVAKIHRDLYLHPINDQAGVSTMEQGWKIALRKLFQYFTPVVVGYGGNDGSLMNMLMGLDPGDIAGRMFWCYREGSPPPEKALNVLRKHRGILVKIPGFDEFMLQLAAKLVTDFDVAAIAERTAKLGQERATRYRDQASKLGESSAQGSPAEQRVGEIMTQSVLSGQSWWAWELRAKSEPDFEKRSLIYLEGISHFPTSAELAGNYAIFLANQHKDYEASEVMFKKAIALDPTNSINTSNYALLLDGQHRDYDATEAMFKMALKSDPNNPGIMGNYANFLIQRRKDSDASEALYKKALELDPTRAINTGNFAYFLAHVRKDYSTAETMFKRALELDPTGVGHTGNFAQFLADCREDFDAAEEMFKKALKLDPNHAENTSLYAQFLVSHRRDYDTAEAMFKKAFEFDSRNTENLGRYAQFLMNHRGDYDTAEAMFKKALEIDPSNVVNTSNFAHFLSAHSEDQDAAEVMFKKAFELDPSNVVNTRNFANFLSIHREDQDAAKAIFKKALEFDPTNESITSDYALFLESLHDDPI